MPDLAGNCPFREGYVCSRLEIAGERAVCGEGVRILDDLKYFDLMGACRAQPKTSCSRLEEAGLAN